jgi:hypothetical protein
MLALSISVIHQPREIVALVYSGDGGMLWMRKILRKSVDEAKWLLVVLAIRTSIL